MTFVSTRLFGPPFPAGGDLPQHYYDTFDPFVTLGACAAVTKKLRLATGIALAFTRSPFETALAALDLFDDRASLEFVAERGRNKAAAKRARGTLRASDEEAARAARAALIEAQVAQAEAIAAAQAAAAPAASASRDEAAVASVTPGVADASAPSDAGTGDASDRTTDSRSEEQHV